MISTDLHRFDYNHRYVGKGSLFHVNAKRKNNWRSVHRTHFCVMFPLSHKVNLSLFIMVSKTIILHEAYYGTLPLLLDVILSPSRTWLARTTQIVPETWICSWKVI